MSNGQGCTCNAWSANECACGADWTPQEVYDLRAENNRLKAELKSIDGALDDPRANLTLTTAEIIWEIKAELAEAKKDAELVDACHEFINSPISVESCERFNKTFEAMKGK